MAILNSNSNSKQKTPPTNNKKKSSLTSSTPQQQQIQLQTVINDKNNSINNTSSDSTSSNANTSSTTNSNNNIHINEFYYHAQQIQQEIKPKEIPICIQPQLPSKSELNKNNYVPHQKTDRVVVKIKNKSINTNSNNSSKLNIKQKPSSEQNKSQLKYDSGSKATSSPSNTLNEQITNINLNNSLLSDNDSSDNRQHTRVSAKIQQLLNTLKVKQFFFTYFVFGITLIFNNKLN
jgi:hypothetical protein